MQNMKYVHSIKQLPIKLQNCLKEANVFYSSNYAEYITNSTLSNYIYLYSEKYVMPMVLNKKLCFKFAYFPVEPYEYNFEEKENIDEFLENAIKTIKKDLKVQWISPTFASALFSTYPKGSKRIPFGSHIIDLGKNEEELFAELNGKHRNVIKKAEKDGVVIKNGSIELLGEYIALDNETWKRSNKTGKGIEFYKNVLDKLKDNCIIYIAYKDEEPQSGAMFFYNQAMSYYMFGASKDSPYTGAMNLLHWEAIKNMKNMGVKKYSFVGCRMNVDEDSKLQNIQRFKERFGGELVSGYMFKVVLNSFYYEMYKLMLRLKNRSGTPTPDPIEQEIHKWKELNNE